MRAAISASQTLLEHARSSSMLSPGGTIDRRRARCPRAASAASAAGEMMARDRLVGDDRDLGAGPQRRDARAERGEQAAADHDVVAARAERDVDDDRIAGSQRRGHDA